MAELRAWFNQDWKCLDWLRWQTGSRSLCEASSTAVGRRIAGVWWQWQCAGCDRRVSAAVGMIFGGTRTSPTLPGSGAVDAAGPTSHTVEGRQRPVRALLVRFLAALPDLPARGLSLRQNAGVSDDPCVLLADFMSATRRW
jgi:hypothetical protein